MKIKKEEFHLGLGVYSILCKCSKEPFFVNVRKETNYSRATGKVRCPWHCGREELLSEILKVQI
jgi:hypothetical protein